MCALATILDVTGGSSYNIYARKEKEKEQKWKKGRRKCIQTLIIIQKLHVNELVYTKST